MSKISIGLHAGIGFGETILDGAVFIGSGALAAVALSSLIGAAGGALGATFGWLSAKPVQWILESVFNTDKATASLISKVVQFAVSFFTLAGCFMLNGPIMGRPIEFGAACAVAGTTLGIVIAISIPLLLSRYFIESAIENA